MSQRHLIGRMRICLLIWLGFCGATLPEAQAATESITVVMGFYLPGIRDLNLTDVRVSLQIWAEEVGRGFGMDAIAVTYSDMKALRRDVLQGQVVIVVAPGMEIAEAFRPDEMAGGFGGRQNGTDSGLVLVVAKRAGIGKFADLEGKRVLRLSNDRLAETYLEILCLRERGTPCREQFSLSEEKRDVQSIHKVFFGKADAALVSLGALQAATEMNPQVGLQLSVVQEWKTASMSYGMTTIYGDPAHRELILKSGLQATNTVRGRQILQIFKTDYMVGLDKTALEPYWLLSKQYQDLLKARSGKKKMIPH